MPLAMTAAYMAYYFHKRYRSPLASAPLARAEHFLVKYFGLIPPPNNSEKTDTLSRFLIRVGQDPSLSPVSVCWSVTGSPTVIVNTLKGIRDVLIDGQVKSKVKNEPSKVQRGTMIRVLQNLVFGGDNLNNTIGEEWRWRRHILLPPFQPKQLVPKLLPYVATRASSLLDLFEKQAATGEAIELDELFMDMTMDVINYYLYGRNELNYDIVGGRTNLKVKKSVLPFGINKTNWGQRIYKPARELIKTFIRDSLVYAREDYERDVKEFEEQGIPERQRSYRSVAACAIASGRYDANQVDLVNDMLTLTFAGYDTTAHTLAFAFSELARNPQLQDELFAQVRQVLGPPPVAPESITAEKLARMPLVTAVYRETLRKYPAVAFIPVHVNRDTVVDGVVVPGGAEIWCNVRGIQMNPAIFPNPDVFDTSRWLRPDDKASDGTSDNAFDNLTTTGSSHDTVTPETQYNFPDLSFTLGQHACLGKNLAILELRTVIACAMNQFTCTLKKDSIIDTKIVLTTKPRHGVWCNFKKRD
ncbi:cytochrome P450 [Parasitella parasitica]|nr:cytochrome P450 [Parasitella parasitica]